jgi:hypothetical protein
MTKSLDRIYKMNRMLCPLTHSENCVHSVEKISSQPICVAGGERSLRSKVRAKASFFPHPQRHDPSAAPFLCAESQIREDCGGETCSAHSLAAEVATNSTCDPVDAGVAHNSARPYLPQLPYGDRWELIVTLNTGQFTLVEIHNGAIAIRVSAPEAQTIQDYLTVNWPVGTVVQWIVVPPFQPVTPAPARNRLRFIPSV